MVSIEEHKKVEVWEATFLVLNCPNSSKPRSKDFLVLNVAQQISYLNIEDACHQVRAIHR